MPNLLPISFGGGRHPKQVEAGATSSCAVLDNVSIKCWGYGIYGQLGYENETTRGDEVNEMGDNLPAVSY